jgi:acetyltransferase-like isoleucine patch superfamily enzyme
VLGNQAKAPATTRDLLCGFSGVKISATAVFEEYFSYDIPSVDFLLTFEEKVHFKRYCHLLLYSKSELIIKKNAFFNNYCSINCLEKIEIGENTMFGEGVKLYDHNHLYEVTDKLTVFKDRFKTSPIVIGNNCWIGSNVTILKGVTIGDNVIIGANNLIYKSIPSNTVVRSNCNYSILEADINNG